MTRAVSFDVVETPPMSWSETVVVLSQDWPPAHLLTVRMYEWCTSLPPGADLTDAELDILRDALLDGRYHRARDLTRGCAGPWRPSSARISLVECGTQQHLLHEVSAMSVWWNDLDCNAPPNAAYRIRVKNETDRTVTYRGDLLFGPGLW